MRVVIALTFDAPTPEDIPSVLTALNPPGAPHFAGVAHVVVEPHAGRLLHWLDAPEDPAVPSYSAAEASSDVVEGIIRDYIARSCALADSGTPTGADAASWSGAIDQLKNLYLAEPNLPAAQILDALRLLGWTDPESSIS